MQKRVSTWNGWPPRVAVLSDDAYAKAAVECPWSPGVLVDARYRIESLIARGRSSSVYEVRHERTRRTFALKVFAPIASAEQREIFRSTVARVIALSSTFAVPLLDGGFQGTRPYVVMPRLRGVTLAARLRFGPLDLHDVLRCGMHLCTVLSSAHEKGLLHGDLRASSVYLVHEGSRIFVQLLDLGMATSEGPSALVSMARTAKHPPPEVAAVPSRRTEASDIWALGHLLRRASFGEAPPDELPPNLAAIDKIFQRCLETNPRDRYASCDDIHRDLAACCLPEATEPRGFV